MRKLLSIIVLVLLATTVCFPQQDVVRRIPVRQHPYYAPNVLPALKQLVADRGKAKRNHFYVGKVDVLENGYHSVLVYWKENRALVLWEPGRGFDNPRYDLSYSRRHWELDKDVVPTLNDVGGSSFLLTRSDARKMVRDCVRYGERHTVSR